MNRIVFLPRVVAAKWRPVPNSVLVSIHDCDEEPLQPQDGWAEVLWLRFHDTDGEQSGLEVFSAQQAEQILELAKRHADASELIVHCQMGQSRSAAIALFLSEHLSLPCFKEQTPVTAMTWLGYNKKVYSTLAAACYGPVGSAFGVRED